MITKEVIEKQILDSYETLGFKPRGNQPEIIFGVLDAFLNKNKQNVVLNAATGVGKSLIGAVVSECLTALSEPIEDTLPAIIMMGTNSLSTQYAGSFSHLDKSKVFQIKGAANYDCNFMASQPMAKFTSGEDCIKPKLHPMEQDKYCSNCEFDKAKKIINRTDNLITNYAYFFTAAFASGHLKPRNLNIFDEAHVISDIFCTYSEIVLSVDLLDKYIKELTENANGKCDNEIAGLIMLKDKITQNQIDDSNYEQYLKVLLELYKSIKTILGQQAAALEKVDIVKCAKLDKMASKYGRNQSKINDLFEKEYEHVFDNSTPNTFTVKTIFIGDETEKLLAQYNLFMSATITEQYAFEILNLKKSDTEFIMTDPVFPPENKPLFFIGKAALNYNSLKDPEVINELKAKIGHIVDYHKDDKGLILVPSFYLGSQLVKSLKSVRVFEHKSGVNLSDLISEFKQYKKPAVLVSPSIFEGLDFAGDASRYQIITKTPYASLGEKRIRLIADKYPNVYKEMALLKILQGIGRSVRSPEDKANTYFLDSSSKKLFDSKLNIWKNHYDVKR